MRIFIRPITESDTANIVKWRNSEKVHKHCMSKIPVTMESHMQYYRNKVLTGKNIQFIVERIEEELGLAAYPIATIYLKDVDNENHRCELCVFTSCDVEWETEGQILATKMILENLTDEERQKDMNDYPLKRYGKPEEISWAIIYLLSDASAWVTGSSLTIDGGFMLK